MIRIWIRSKRGGTREWSELEGRDTLHDAVQHIIALGPIEFRFTDQNGAEILKGSITHKARQFASRPRFKIHAPLTFN